MGKNIPNIRFVYEHYGGKKQPDSLLLGIRNTEWVNRDAIVFDQFIFKTMQRFFLYHILRTDCSEIKQ